MRTGEVDDDACWQLLDRRGPGVGEAENRHVRLVLERLGVRNEIGHRRAFEPRVEGAGGLPRERVRPHSGELERRVPENAIECLLPRVPGRADNADGLHPA